jgi:hypothetical protein
MKKAIIITGIEDNSTENYQLLIGCNYVSLNYNHKKSREDFLKEIIQEFAEILARQERGEIMEVGILNGYKISKNGHAIRIGAIENSIVMGLSEELKSKLSKMEEIGTFPVAGTN